MLVERGRCPDHTLVQRRARGTTKERGYGGTWRSLRKMILRRDMHLCQECLKSGITERAIDVDHKIPMDQGGERLDPDNLQSLCKACHGKKTRKENSPS